MNRMIKYLLRYWKIALLSPALMLVEVVIDLYLPLLLKKVIDVGIAESDVELIQKYVFYMILLAIIGMVSAVSSGFFAVHSSLNAGADIRSDLFQKVQTLSFKNLDHLKTGSVITRLTNDVIQIQQFFGLLMRLMVRAPFMLVGSIILTFYINMTFGITLLLLIIALVFVISLVVKQARPLFKQAQKKMDGVNNIMLENIKGIRVIKAFVRRDYENNRFATENEGVMGLQTEAVQRFSVVIPAIMLTVNLVVIAVLWFGSFNIVDGTLSVGEIVAVLNYVTRLMFSLMMIGMIFFRVSKAIASAERINEIFDTEPDIEHSKNQDHKTSEKIETIEGDITFQNLSFKYEEDSERDVLKNLDFTIKRGETLAIIGATGSGKSTILQLICGFYRATEGAVLIDGQDVHCYGEKSLRSQIAYVQQHTFIFSGTVQSNIFFDKAPEEGVLRDAQGESILDPEAGFQTEIQQQGRNLSGGQKQRLAIARGLAMKPKILLLDDSMSGLDIGTESRLKKALKDHYADTTVIVVAQRISSVISADKIMVIDAGGMVAFGAHQDLISESAVYRDIYESQLNQGVS